MTDVQRQEAATLPWSSELAVALAAVREAA